MSKQTKKIPGEIFAQACCEEFAFAAGEPEADGSVPFSMVALSGNVLDRGYMQVIQDLSGMTHAPKITVDYCHDTSEVLGYVDKIDASKNKLTLSGRLTPFQPGDRASEVIHKMRAGVPYQSSIYFPPAKRGDTSVEYVPSGAQTEVNGKTIKGPVDIFRKWVLRGVAVCPHGLDGNTSTYLQAAGTQDMEVELMSAKNTPAPSADNQQTPAPTEPTPTPAVVPAVTPPVAPVAQTPDARADFKQFVEAFGKEQAADYYAQGVAMADAWKLHSLHLTAKLAEVAKQTAALEAEKATLCSKIAELKQVAGAGADSGGDVPPKTLPWSDEQIKDYCKQNGHDFATFKQSLIAKK